MGIELGRRLDMGKMLKTIGIACILLCTTITASLAQSVERLRVGIHTTMTRIVLDVRGEADLAYEVAGTGQGKALLIAFPKVSWNAAKTLNTPKGVVSGYRFKAHAGGGALAISTTKPIKIKRSFILPASGRRGARIVFDLVDGPAMPELHRVATQRISAPLVKTPKRMVPAEPAQVAQAIVLPQEPWLKTWLSAPVPGKGSSAPSSGGHNALQNQQAPLNPQIKPSYRTPYTPPVPPAAPMPIGATDQVIPQVPNSLAPKYQLPRSARLDPIQQKTQEFDTQGGYMGVNFGGSFLDVTVSNNEGTAEIESTQTYFKLFGGYRFTRIFSMEVFYADLGKSSQKTDTNLPAEASLSGPGFAVQAGYPIVEWFIPFAKVGFIYLDIDGKINEANVGGHSGKSYFGAGIDFWLMPNIAIRGEYENYGLNTDTISAGMIYKF